MADPLYQQYTIKDFDCFDCLKLSKGLYFTLAFVLRGYIVWLVSVANFSDQTSFITFVFPEKQYFYLSLLSGCLGLGVLLLVSLRKPNAPSWVETSWAKVKALLITALICDWLITVVCFYWGFVSQLSWLIAHSVIVGCFLVYCFKSKRLSINIIEFPKPFEDK